MSEDMAIHRNRVTEDTFPHLDSLWQSAFWLTANESVSEELVLNSMRQACREWHLSSTSVSNKVRLFRIFARDFLGNGKRLSPEHKPEHSRRQNGDTTSIYDGESQPDLYVTIPSRRRLLATEPSEESVRRAVARLRPLSRLMMILLVREQFSYAEIAYIVELNIKSVAIILNRLHRHLPFLLGQEGHFSIAETDRWENEGGTFAAESRG